MSVWTPLEGTIEQLVGAAPPGPNGAPTSPVNGLVVDPVHSLVLLHQPGITDGLSLVKLSDGTQVRAFVAVDVKQDPKLRVPLGNATGAMDASSGRVAVFDYSGKGFVFAADTGDPITTFVGGHTSVVLYSTFTSAGQVVSVGLDGSARLWDPDPTRAGIALVE